MKKVAEERSIILYTWGYAIVGFIILLVVSLIWFKDQLFRLPVSFILGWATNLMCFTMTVKVTDWVLKAERPSSSKGIFITLNVVKMVMYLVVLAVAYLADSFEIFSAFAGMLAVKIMIYFKQLIVDPIRNKRLLKKQSEGGDNGE